MARVCYCASEAGIVDATATRMHLPSKISFAIAVAAVFSFAGPAMGNLITQPLHNSKAGGIAFLTAGSNSSQMLLGAANSGHFSRMLEITSDQSFTFTFANTDRDLLRLTVLQFTLRHGFDNALPEATRDPESPAGMLMDPSPKTVDTAPILSGSPTVVSVPDGGFTLLLLGFGLFGLGALRRGLSL